MDTRIFTVFAKQPNLSHLNFDKADKAKIYSFLNPFCKHTFCKIQLQKSRTTKSFDKCQKECRKCRTKVEQQLSN